MPHSRDDICCCRYQKIRQLSQSNKGWETSLLVLLYHSYGRIAPSSFIANFKHSGNCIERIIWALGLPFRQQPNANVDFLCLGTETLEELPLCEKWMKIPRPLFIFQMWQLVFKLFMDNVLNKGSKSQVILIHIEWDECHQEKKNIPLEFHKMPGFSQVLQVNYSLKHVNNWALVGEIP